MKTRYEENMFADCSNILSHVNDHLMSERNKDKRRHLRVIADEILIDWDTPSHAARPYLEVMMTMGSITENYWHAPGYSIVSYFLANAQTWRGETARRIKKELNEMLKS